MHKLLSYLKLIRVKHYIKNILIFVPLVFSGQLLNIQKCTLCLFGFLTFSCVASMVYILNDLRDLEKDRLHSEKKNRPLASGTVSKKAAHIIFSILCIIVCIIDIVIVKCYSFNYIFIILQIVYFILNVGYSLGLKKIPIVDVTILVSGFVLRVMYGGILSQIEISNWLYLTVMSSSFYMSFGKRRNELIKQSDKTRDVLKKYNKNFLDKFIYVSLVLTIVFYSLWCIDPSTLVKFGNNVIWTVPLIFVIFMQYSLDIEGDSSGDPVEILLADKVLLLLSLVFAIIIIGVLYL